MTKEVNTSGSPEILSINSKEIGVGTSFMYRKWYQGELKSPDDVDKIRGDLALEMFDHANEFTFIAVDGGSSDEFKQELNVRGLNIQDETEKE